tara:strand:- start:1204 stop:1704 length:501 start_codon:yes stop_codon:yes gene_type:complete
MGILDSNIDWDNVDENQQGDYAPVPEGTYTIEGVSFEEKQYRSGNEGIDIQFKVVGPSHENRRIFETFVLTGSNPNVAIGRLKAFVKGVGINVDTTPLNTQTLGAAMNQPLQANISIEPGSNGYPPKNKIKSFLSPNAEPAQQQSAPAAAPAQQAAQPTGQQVNWN